MDRDIIRRYISTNEGVRFERYFDTEGIETIGVGFNLRRQDARDKIEALGLDYDNVLNGEVSLTREQVDSLLDHDIDQAISDAESLCSNFSSLSDTRQCVLVDMSFNLGRSRLAGFRNMLAAIDEQEWDRAANEMEDSRWFRQVGRRGQWDCDAMRSDKLPEFESA